MSNECHVLGTGTMDSQFHNTNLLFQIEGGNLLVDCGFTIKTALQDQGRTLSEIDAVYITHVHGDHAFGLEQLGYNAMFHSPRRVTLFLERGLKPVLWDQCLKGSMQYTGRGEHELEDYFDIEIVENHEFRFRSCHFETFATQHTPGKSTYGIIADENFVHTSDTMPLCWLRYAGDRFDRILHDCSSQYHSGVHSSYREIIDYYPDDVRKRLTAIHYDDRIDEICDELSDADIDVAEAGDVYDV